MVYSSKRKYDGALEGRPRPRPSLYSETPAEEESHSPKREASSPSTAYPSGPATDQLRRDMSGQRMSTSVMSIAPPSRSRTTYQRRMSSNMSITPRPQQRNPPPPPPPPKDKLSSQNPFLKSLSRLEMQFGSSKEQAAKFRHLKGGQSTLPPRPNAFPPISPKLDRLSSTTNGQAMTFKSKKESTNSRKQKSEAPTSKQWLS